MIPSIYDAGKKVKDTIESCETNFQLEGAIRLWNRFIDLYGDYMGVHQIMIDPHDMGNRWYSDHPVYQECKAALCNKMEHGVKYFNHPKKFRA